MALKSFSSFQILCSVLLLALVTATQAAPNAVITKATTPPASKTTTVPSPTPTACGFRGDDNTYGLGMRLGIYLQWFAAWIAYAWVPSEVVTMRALNKYFLLSNFIGLLYITFSQGANQPSGQLYAIECWIVLTFCLGGILTGSTLFETSRSSLLDSIIRVALINATTFYAVWFIYVGMDTMLAPTCSRSVFFYAKVDLFHWFRIFCKCLINIGAIFAAWWALELCLRIIEMVRTGRMEPKEPNEESQRYGWRHAGLSHVLVLFIVSTELTLVWNNTHGINTIRGTAQILPVVVAGIGMIRVLWKAIEKRRSSATP